MSNTSEKRDRTNATVRLSNALDRISSVSGGSINFATAISLVLGSKTTESNRKILTGYAKLTRLLDNSQKEILTYLSTEQDFYGAMIPRLYALFNPLNGGQQWETVKIQLKLNSDVIGLRHTGQRLKSIVSEFQSVGNEISDIKKALEEMSRSVQESADISLHTKEVLLQRVQDIEDAVEECYLWGVRGIEDAFGAYTATLNTDPVVQNDIKADAKAGGEVGKKVLKLGGALLWTIGALNGLHDFNQNCLPTIERLLLPSVTQQSNTPNSHQPPTSVEIPLPAKAPKIKDNE